VSTSDKQDRQIGWLLQTLNDFNGSGEVGKYLDGFVVTDHDSLVSRLVHAIRRSKCPALIKPQFIAWCKRQIDQHADALIPFFLAKRIKEQNGRITIRDVFNIVALHGKVRKGTACFPRTIINGDVALIDTGKEVLKIPACPDSDDPAENFLPVLELLWPWHERQGIVVKSSSREVSGRSSPIRIPLHQLFVAFQYGNWSDEPVHAKDGDFLNWTNGNLYRTSQASGLPAHDAAQMSFEDSLLQVIQGLEK